MKVSPPREEDVFLIGLGFRNIEASGFLTNHTVPFRPETHLLFVFAIKAP